MPGGKEPDALDQVLKGYGIAPEDIPAMRTAVLDGTASISQEALSQAAQNVAGDNLTYMGAMTEMAKATKNREIDPTWYEQLVASRGRAGIQREAASISKSAKHSQAFDLQNAANDELLRLGSMTDYLDDLSPRGAAVTSGFREPGPGMLGLIPLDENMRRTVGPAPAGPTTPPNALYRDGQLIPADEYEATSPYAQRLKQAQQFRTALLGK